MARIRPHRDLIARRRAARIHVACPTPARARSPRSIPQQATGRIRCTRSQLAHRNPSRNQICLPAQPRVHVLLRRRLHSGNWIRRQGNRTCHRSSGARQIAPRTHRGHRLVHIRFGSDVACISRLWHVRRVAENFRASNRLRPIYMHYCAVIRFRRQRRIHVLHRHRLSCQPRPRRSSHFRQSRRRLRWHRPELRPYLPRP